jgi:hypothetical protein
MAVDPAGILPKFYEAYRWSSMGDIRMLPLPCLASGIVLLFINFFYQEG